MQATDIDAIKQHLQHIIEQENEKLSDKLERILQQNHHFSLLAAQLQQHLNLEIEQSRQLLNRMANRYSDDVELALQTFIDELSTDDDGMQTLLLQRESHRLEQEIYQKSSELDVEITLLHQSLNTLIENLHRDVAQAVEKPSRLSKVRLVFQQKYAPIWRKHWRQGRIQLGHVLERFALKLKAA